MIRYELKKNIVYNRFWLLILFVVAEILLGCMMTKDNANDLDRQNYLYYHEHLHGQLTAEKTDFIDNESIHISEYSDRSDSLYSEYRDGLISDQQYIEELEQINEYHYRSGVFEDILEYTNYLKDDSSRLYINEEHMNSYLNRSVPYVIIIIIILDVIISFQREESMYLLTKTTSGGKKRLIRTKVLTLIMINLAIFIIYSLLTFFSRFDLKYVSELMAPVESTRMFAGTYFQGNMISYMLVCFVMQWAAVVILTVITAIVCLKTRLGSIKQSIIEIAVYIVSFELFGNFKWMYVLFPVGFFDPNRYFTENISNDAAAVMPADKTVLLTAFGFLALLVIILFLRRKKLFQMPLLICLCMMLTGCQNSQIRYQDIAYKNSNDFNMNADFLVDIDQLIDLKSRRQYSLNRNVLDDLSNISPGFMDHQYYYFTATNDNQWSLYRLDTATFEQQKIYTGDLVKYDVLGNVISSPLYNNPGQIYVKDHQIYITYYNRIERMKNNQTEVILDESGHIIEITDQKMYFINDKHQLEELEISTGKHHVCMDSLVSRACIDKHDIYYTSLRNGNLYHYNRTDKSQELLVNEDVNCFEINDNSLYYTVSGGHGISIMSLETKEIQVLFPDIEIYMFSVFDTVIVYTAKGAEKNEILTYLYDNNDVYKIVN